MFLFWYFNYKLQQKLDYLYIFRKANFKNYSKILKISFLMLIFTCAPKLQRHSPEKPTLNKLRNMYNANQTDHEKILSQDIFLSLVLVLLPKLQECRDFLNKTEIIILQYHQYFSNKFLKTLFFHALGTSQKIKFWSIKKKFNMNTCIMESIWLII